MSEYTDIRNNTYQIHQRSLVNTSQAEQQKQEIIEELYRIFEIISIKSERRKQRWRLRYTQENQ